MCAWLPGGSDSSLNGVAVDQVDRGKPVSGREQGVLVGQVSVHQAVAVQNRQGPRERQTHCQPADQVICLEGSSAPTRTRLFGLLEQESSCESTRLLSSAYWNVLGVRAASGIQ